MNGLHRAARATGSAALLLGLPTAAAAGPGRPEDAVGILAIALLLLVAIPSLATVELLIMALLPGPVGAARDVLLRRRLQCLAAGVAALLLGAVLVGVFSQIKGIGELLGVLIIAALILGVILGLPAMGVLAGRAVLEMSGRTPSTLAAAAWGLVLILFGSLFPVLGWSLFVFVCLAALGAVVLALPEMRRPARRSLEEEPPLPDAEEPEADA